MDRERPTHAAHRRLKAMRIEIKSCFATIRVDGAREILCKSQPLKFERNVKTIALDNRHRQQIFHLLIRDVDANLFLIDILMRRGISNWGREKWDGVFKGDHLIALSVSLGRIRPTSQAKLIVAYGDKEACGLLGEKEWERGGAEMLIGERTAIDGIYNGMGQPQNRLFADQRLYRCEQVTDGPELECRWANEDDFDMVCRYSAQMMAEDLGINPLSDDPTRHMTSIHHRLSQKKTQIGEERGEICFLLDVGTSFKMGAQVGGTFVPKPFRGKGISKRGMRWVTRKLLQSCECITLHVNESNTAAIRCYEAVGYTASTAYRMISLFPDKNHEFEIKRQAQK